MKFRFAVSCILALFSNFQFSTEAVAQDREEIAYTLPSGIDLRDSIASALAEVVKEHERLLTLGLRHNEKKFQLTDENKLELERIRKSYEAFFENRPYPAWYASNFVLYESGQQAFARALKSDPGLEPKHLEPLLDERFLEAPPLIGCRAWEELLVAMRSDPRVPDGALPEIGNPSARFLVWGALNTPEFWEHPHGKLTKEAFISFMIAEGDRNRFTAQAVLDALQPPVVSDERSTVAGPFVDLRAPVGFTKLHLEMVDSILEEILEEKRVADEDPYAIKAELNTETGKLTRRIPPLAFRPRWAADLRALINSEVNPKETIAFRKNGTLEEQQHWWLDMAACTGYADFELLALQHLTEIFGSPLSGETKHPNDEEMRRLINLAMSRGAKSPLEAWHGSGLCEADRDKLQELWGQRDQDCLSIAKFALTLLGKKGTGPYRRDLMRALIDRVPKQLPPESRSFLAMQLTQGAWDSFSESDPQGSLELLRERKSGDELAARTPRYGVSPVIQNLIIGGLQGKGVDGSNQLLQELASDGTVYDRASAMQNSEFFGNKAQGLLSKALSDLADPEATFNPEEARWLGSGVVNALRSRSKRSAEPWVAKLLQQSFGFQDPDGDGRGTYGGKSLWEGDNPLNWLAPEKAEQEWIVNALPASVFAELKQVGKIPESMAALRHND